MKILKSTSEISSLNSGDCFMYDQKTYMVTKVNAKSLTASYLCEDESDNSSFELTFKELIHKIKLL